MLALINQPSPAGKGDRARARWMRRAPFVQNNKQAYTFFNKNLKISEQSEEILLPLATSH